MVSLHQYYVDSFYKYIQTPDYTTNGMDVVGNLLGDSDLDREHIQSLLTMVLRGAEEYDLTRRVRDYLDSIRCPGESQDLPFWCSSNDELKGISAGLDILNFSSPRKLLYQLAPMSMHRLRSIQADLLQHLLSVSSDNDASSSDKEEIADITEYVSSLTGISYDACYNQMYGSLIGIRRRYETKKEEIMTNTVESQFDVDGQVKTRVLSNVRRFGRIAFPRSASLAGMWSEVYGNVESRLLEETEGYLYSRVQSVGHSRSSPLLTVGLELSSMSATLTEERRGSLKSCVGKCAQCLALEPESLVLRSNRFCLTKVSRLLSTNECAYQWLRSVHTAGVWDELLSVTLKRRGVSVTRAGLLAAYFCSDAASRLRGTLISLLSTIFSLEFNDEQPINFDLFQLGLAHVIAKARMLLGNMARLDHIARIGAVPGKLKLCESIESPILKCQCHIPHSVRTLVVVWSGGRDCYDKLIDILDRPFDVGACKKRSEMSLLVMQAYLDLRGLMITCQRIIRPSEALSFVVPWTLRLLEAIVTRNWAALRDLKNAFAELSIEVKTAVSFLCPQGAYFLPDLICPLGDSL
jgi:hypothetical protein